MTLQAAEVLPAPTCSSPIIASSTVPGFNGKVDPESGTLLLAAPSPSGMPSLLLLGQQHPLKANNLASAGSQRRAVQVLAAKDFSDGDDQKPVPASLSFDAPDEVIDAQALPIAGPQRDYEPGDRIGGRYTVVKKIGQGTGSVAYKVHALWD